LVVDCDKDMVEITTAMLERLGYSTQGELESLRALRTFSDYPDKFDLAIVEPVMPELMG
jgi:CheY-like chemotaxis protein